MIVLDTNVVSELAKPTPNPTVVAWVDAQDELAIAAPALGELRFGVARLPDGKRRTALSEAIDQFVADDLDGLVLAFDTACADAYGMVVAARERAGRLRHPPRRARDTKRQRLPQHGNRVGGPLGSTRRR